ncbi:hypothetical protein FDECE_17337 [Fusarium decemcellulare]|nr:hypothetical protein FDECE_17337 [Fusarium decemcellulare]
MLLSSIIKSTKARKKDNQEPTSRQPPATILDDLHRAEAACCRRRRHLHLYQLSVCACAGEGAEGKEITNDKEDKDNSEHADKKHKR